MCYCSNTRRRLGVGLVLAVTVSCGGMDSAPVGAEFGINLAGAEFGALRADFSNVRPGRHGEDYFFPSRDALANFADRGIRLIRFPVSWERLQPQLGGELDSGYMARVVEFLDQAAGYRCRVVLDLHNYGRYRRQDGAEVRELVVAAAARGDEEISGSFLVDVWLRLAKKISDHPAVHAYGLMNEPHDMAGGDWHATSNQVVGSLRDAGDYHWIWVAGDGWSSAEQWNRHNPPRPWVTDPMDRVAYEAHVYFDADASGKYRMTFTREQGLDPNIEQRGVRRLEPFANWCERNGVVGVIGEFGIPWSDSGWLPVLDRFLSEIGRRDIKACAWAGGEYWGDYILSLQPRSGADVAPLQRILEHASRLAARGDASAPGRGGDSFPR